MNAKARWRKGAKKIGPLRLCAFALKSEFQNGDTRLEKMEHSD